MKIAITSTQFFGCPPKNYGGLELVNWNLACGLAELGHKVVLYAPNESKTPPNGFLYETGPAINTVNVDWLKVERDMWEIYKDTLDEYDIIMGSNWFGLEYKSKALHPEYNVCHVHHGGLNREYWARSRPPFKLNLIAISDHMARVFNSYGFPAKRAYNGINLEDYPYSEEHGDRFLFVGRITKFKGPVEAIQAARKAGVPLDVVGATSFVDDPGFVEQVRGLCDGEQIRFVGEVSHEEKVRYMQSARAILVSSQFGEPFGLVPPESMACGCIPIVYDDGALGEIVEDGLSGFVVSKTVDAMAEAIGRIDEIDPKDCRSRAEKFDRKSLAEGYLKLYDMVLAGDEW